MTDREPYAMGPPDDYDPPPVEDLRDPEVQTRTNARGADLVRQPLAELGIRKDDGGRWTNSNREGERP